MKEEERRRGEEGGGRRNQRKDRGMGSKEKIIINLEQNNHYLICKNHLTVT